MIYKDHFYWAIDARGILDHIDGTGAEPADPIFEEDWKIGMPKFSSVQFFQNFAERRTGLYIRSGKFAERRTRPSVQVQEGPVHHSVGVRTWN